MTSRLKIKIFSPITLILLFIISALSACDKQTVYYTFKNLPNDGWQRKDTLVFDVNASDSLTYYKLSVAIRNRCDYPYQNLNLSINLHTPDSLTYLADTLRVTLSDKEGRWIGSGWGGLFQSDIAAGSIKISKPGIYQLKVAYTLPDSILTGINDIGIKLTR